MGWILVTILLPLAAPSVLLLLFKLVPLPAKTAARVRLLAPVKDGQLCWAALGFCASALYEMAEPGAAGRSLSRHVAGYAQAGFIVMLLAAGVMAAAGSVFPSKLMLAGQGPWYRHYQVLSMSLVLVSMSSAGYAGVHFATAAP